MIIKEKYLKMCKNHYGEEVDKNIRKYGKISHINSKLQLIGFIPDLINIISGYISEEICNNCVQSIIFISKNVTYITFDRNAKKRYNKPDYAIIFLIQTPISNLNYMPQKIIPYNTPQIIQQQSKISYKTPKNKTKVTDINNKYKKQKSAKLFKKTRPLGYKNIQYNFETSEEYDIYFQDDYINYYTKCNCGECGDYY